mmetsp:Transcript_31997/g.71093  ORF Transcript_31997/g.71093 Transcript_31997/m.71093 type:complete len:103 (-) Transcript_31997:807-1115(-)
MQEGTLAMQGALSIPSCQLLCELLCERFHTGARPRKPCGPCISREPHGYSLYCLHASRLQPVLPSRFRATACTAFTPHSVLRVLLRDRPYMERYWNLRTWRR